MPNAAGDVIIIDGSKLKLQKRLVSDWKRHKCIAWLTNNTCVFCAHFSKIAKKRRTIDAKTKFQNVVFTLMMSFLMVYAMICYNISMNIGGMTNQVFLMAFHEMMIIWLAAFILEFFLVDHLAHKLAFAW